MKENLLLEAANAFANYTPDLPIHTPGKMTFVPINSGLINNTWVVRCELKASFLLQQINTNVFSKPEDVQNNYICISQYAEFEFTGLRLPYPRYHNRTESLYIDKNGNYWRAFEFIDDAFTPVVAQKPAQAKATAKTFARFTAALKDFNLNQLKIVIPDFHNLSFRYTQFQSALESEHYERMAKSMQLVDELKKRERYKHFYEIITESPDEFPQRVMHHDAKISNILFSKKTGKVICPVDFDTVMPGYYFSDLGDMIRSMVCSCDENSTSFESIRIRKGFYEAIVTGYMTVMKNYFTDSEKKYIHYAGLLMIYMQALRFITDYLNADIYYRIDYPEQNFDRGRNQLILLKQLEEFLELTYAFKV